MISIIVPVYNAEKTLDVCLKSLVGQTYTDLQILLINDGSTDRSYEICCDWEKKDSRITVVSKENEGLPFARKTGLEYVKGECVMFVDSDDWIESEMVGCLYQLLNEKKADIAICRLVMDYPSGKKKYISNVKEVRVYDSEKAMEEINYNNIEASLCNKMFKTELMKDLDFKKDVTIGEDYRITWQAVRNANKVVCTPQAFYHYIQQSESMVHQGYQNNGFVIIDNYTSIKDKIIQTYPQIGDSAVSYWYLQEMAIIISMIRGKNYEKRVIDYVKKDIRTYLKLYIKNRRVPIYLKICAVLLSLHENFLIVPYRCFFFWREKL